MLVVALLVLVLVAAVVATIARRERARDQDEAAVGKRASAAVSAFVERYVDPTGRVVRHDEGGDTVSEGQAYAMLLTVADGDRAGFERVWGWTKANLQRADGLLSWRWQGGRVADPSPATDADLDAARALIRAGDRFRDPALRSEGLRMAGAILEHVTTEVRGELILVAGPWAVDRRVFNPSYISPCTYMDLEAASGDNRWRRLRDGGYRLVEGLIAGGGLPPDWAQVDDQGRPRPLGPPGDLSQPPRYGLDAVRLPARLAEGCDPHGLALAAQLWPRLKNLKAQGAAVSYGLDGRPANTDEHPAGLVGAAAAARASGADGEAKHLMQRAARLSRLHPTYYGAAWIAMGEVLMDQIPKAPSR